MLSQLNCGPGTNIYFFPSNETSEGQSVRHQFMQFYNAILSDSNLRESPHFMHFGNICTVCHASKASQR